MGLGWLTGHGIVSQALHRLFYFACTWAMVEHKTRIPFHCALCHRRVDESHQWRILTNEQSATATATATTRSVPFV